MGDVFLQKFEHKVRAASSHDTDSRIRKEIARLEKETNLYKEELRRLFMEKFEEDKLSMKNV